MKIVIAKEKDSEKLNAFVHESPWITSFDFKKERTHSFFEKYRLHSGCKGQGSLKRGMLA